MSVLSFRLCVKGEAILPGSFQLQDNTTGLTIVDSENSTTITNESSEYLVESFDFSTGEVILVDSSSTELYIESIDFNTGEVEISYNGVLESPNPTLTTLNGLSSKLSFSTPLTILDQVDGVISFIWMSYSNKVVI